MQSINEIFPLLNQPKRIVITTHQKPDGDAMGSSLGLYHFLKPFGHHITVISPTNWASFLNWMPDCNLVIDYENKTASADEIMESADWIFCLDFNTLVRTKRMEEKLKSTAALKILIDHHQEPQTEAFAYGISNPKKSSTAEMVYDFIVDAGYAKNITEPIAQCLYAGVMTDTGSFRHPSTTPSVHSMVSALLETGLNQSKIHENLFDNHLETRLRFIGNILTNRMQVFYEYNAALITIPQSDLVKYEVKTGDTEGLVNFPLSIKGIKLVAIIIDRGEERKFSFRSKGDFDVNTFARKYFNGGGHFNAAGGISIDTLENAEVKFKKALEENKEQLSTYQF